MKILSVFAFVLLMVFNIMLIEKFQDIYLLILLILGIIGILILGIVQEIGRNNQIEQNKIEIVRISDKNKMKN